jgi:hypothetical protein
MLNKKTGCMNNIFQDNMYHECKTTIAEIEATMVDYEAMHARFRRGSKGRIFRTKQPI